MAEKVKKRAGMSGRTLNLLVILTVTAVLAGIAGLAAYFTDADTVTNTFYVDNNEIEPRETFEKPVPGKKTVKRPAVFNAGSTECYVRAMVLLSDSRAAEYLEYYTDSAKGINAAYWTQEEDGWLYYKGSIKNGETTEPVFTHIKLSESIPDLFSEFVIDVVFESVQKGTFGNHPDAFAAISGGGAK